MSTLVAAQVMAFPNGAPRSACGSMSPIHMLFSAQDGQPTITLTASPSQVTAGSTVTGFSIVDRIR